MKRTLPGEGWRVDFGLAAKVRPALVLSDFPGDDELALLVVIPHTTAVRGNLGKIPMLVSLHHHDRCRSPSVHTPFRADRSLNLAAVEQQAAHLLRNGISLAFVGGTTGECHSLSLEERLALARRWSEVAQGTALKLSIHVGSNCLAGMSWRGARSVRLAGPSRARRRCHRAGTNGELTPLRLA